METTLDLCPYQVAIVIGVDHKLQHFVQGLAPSHTRNILRLRFLDFLRDLTSRYPVEVICEESKLGLESIAQTVAIQSAIRYWNIEMPARRRAELAIPTLYTSDVPGSEMPAEQKAKWTALPESHLVDELLDAVAGAVVLIVICAVSHMPALVQALQMKFRRVAQYDVTAMP
jgi:hypothetical protein